MFGRSVCRLDNLAAEKGLGRASFYVCCFIRKEATGRGKKMETEYVCVSVFPLNQVLFV